MHGRLASPTKPQVTRTRMSCHGTSSLFGLLRISRSHDDHPRKRPHDGQVFGGMMRHAEWAVGKASTPGHHLNIRIVIADVVSHLLQAAQGREVRYGIGEDNLASECHPSRDAGHILFGDPSIEKMLGESLRKGFYNSKTQVPNNQHDPFFALGQL